MRLWSRKKTLFVTSGAGWTWPRLSTQAAGEIPAPPPFNSEALHSDLPSPSPTSSSVRWRRRKWLVPLWHPSHQARGAGLREGAQEGLAEWLKKRSPTGTAPGACPVLSDLSCISHTPHFLIPSPSEWAQYYYSHFTDQKTKVPRYVRDTVDLVAYKQQNFILIACRLENPRSRCQQLPCLVRAHFPADSHLLMW